MNYWYIWERLMSLGASYLKYIKDQKNMFMSG